MNEIIIMLDTETCNTLEDNLIYDIGFMAVTREGEVLERKSFVNADIYLYEKELMKSAYYADKLPQYEQELKEGKRKLAKFSTIQKILCQLMRKYETQIICCHNASFDSRALNRTQRYITKSAKRFTLPYGTIIWDTLKGARQTIGKEEAYKEFCETNGYMTKHKKPRARLTAEIIYRYLTNDLEFVEAHKGIEDCEIESQILVYILKNYEGVELSLYA